MVFQSSCQLHNGHSILSTYISKHRGVLEVQEEAVCFISSLFLIRSWWVSTFAVFAYSCRKLCSKRSTHIHCELFCIPYTLQSSITLHIYPCLCLKIRTSFLLPENRSVSSEVSVDDFVLNPFLPLHDFCIILIDSVWSSLCLCFYRCTATDLI